MRRLTVFNSVTLDGYFTDKNNDMSWAHKSDPEWNEFVAENSKSGGELLFGRVTYEMMAGFWPTPMAATQFPEVARQMNDLPKFVFSRTLDSVSWQNTRLMKGELIEEVIKLKQEAGEPIVILGSGSIVSQLASENLIDEYQIVMHPIVLGGGRTMFDGIKNKVHLKLTNSRVFKNGSALLSYEPAK